MNEISLNPLSTGKCFRLVPDYSKVKDMNMVLIPYQRGSVSDP